MTARRKRRLPSVLAPGEAVTLLGRLDPDSGWRDLRDRCVLELMYRAGLRVGEVVRLAVRDIELDGVVRVHDGKGGDGTAYFSASRVAPLISRWLDARAEIAPGGDVLFVDARGGPVSVRYVQRLVARLKVEAGIGGKCTPHVLRHTFATERLDEGFSIREVQELLRHANVATTEVYTHVFEPRLRDKMQST